jgi:hypothetical protein
MENNRLNISTGLFCENCGKDCWFVYQGFNRCECGSYLWVEKREDGTGRHFRYRQGGALPQGYRGWMAVTQ